MFQSKSVQPPFKSMDLANVVILVYAFCLFFRPQTCSDVRVFISSMPCSFCSIPCTASRSNHYVDKVGVYHRILICTLDPPNASPMNRNVSIFVHPCRSSEPNHSLLSDSLSDMYVLSASVNLVVARGATGPQRFMAGRAAGRGPLKTKNPAGQAHGGAWRGGPRIPYFMYSI